MLDSYNFHEQRLSFVNLNCLAISANYLNILLPNELLSITLVEITLKESHDKLFSFIEPLYLVIRF